MKKFFEWLKSPASDFSLFVILLVLINVVSYRFFMRLDLTSQRSYSLSAVSRRTVKTLSEPLSVNVFFSDNLPAPYNSISQYVRDILVEYKGAANRNFSYTFFDMNKPENMRIAGGYGLRQIQIQEVKNNEVGFKQVWLGLSLSYGDSVEAMDEIISTDGFEYNFTTKIANMISKTDALAGLVDGEAISLTLYSTDALKNFRINGFDQAGSLIQQAFDSVNKKNMNRLVYFQKNPSMEEAETIANKYGLQLFNWQNKDGSEGKGVFGLVLEYGDSFRVIPLSVQRSLFGHIIMGMDSVERNVNDSLQGLLSNSTQIGYVTGHGEAELTGQDGEDSNFAKLVSDMYEFVNLNLLEDDIPANLNTIVINGASSEFSEKELYKIDQFLLRGGTLMVFQDPFKIVQGNYYQPATYLPINTGLEKILEKNGIKLEKNYVMDENCYVARQQGMGNIKLYWAPMLHKKQLSLKNPITKNLGYVIFLQSGAIDVSLADENKDLKATVLAKSSAKSWKESKDIELSPNMNAPFDKSVEKSENLAVLVEGRFESSFETSPDGEASSDGLSSRTHLTNATQTGKIIAISSAFVTSNQLLDDNGKEPVALLIRNAIDYLNGNSDLCLMRTKGLSLNALSNTNSILAVIVKYFAQFGLALFVAAAGLIVWKFRSLHKKTIRAKYNPNDEREITTKNK